MVREMFSASCRDSNSSDARAASACRLISLFA